MKKDNSKTSTIAPPYPPLTIALIGDSTVADYPDDHHLRGWGQLLPQLCTDNVTVKNFAKCGRSSKSFIHNGLWENALAEKADYLLIQFGHNDCPGKGERSTDPNQDYQQYLTCYITETRNYGGHPIIVTPMERRNFSKENTLKLTLNQYAAAARTVAQAQNVPLIDLNRYSIKLYEKLGDQGSAFLMCPEDRTHFVFAGAEILSTFVATELYKNIPELRPYLLLPDTAAQ